MAVSVKCVVMCLCQLSLTLLPVSADRSHVGSSAVSPTHIGQNPMACGDDLCICTRKIADCSGLKGKLTYVPSFPDSVSIVVLSDNNLSSNILTDNFFANLTKIEILILQQSNLTWLPQKIFEGMKELNCLSVAYNEALQIESVRTILSIPTLTVVSLDNCNLPSLPVGFFQNSTSHVGLLRLNFNPHCGTYPLKEFCALQFLKTLELNNCDFRDIATPCSLQQLHTLSLHMNLLTRFPETCVGTASLFPALETLKLTYNRIQTLSTSNVCLPSLKDLDLSHNFIKFYPTGAFNHVKFPQLQDLRLYDQSELGFRGEASVEDYAFDNDNLKYLDLGKNGMKFAKRDSIGMNAFANCHGIQLLDLSFNHFTNVDDQRFFQLFGHLHSLDTLLIVGSMFESISTRTFANFPELQVLYLDGNMIADVPDGAFDSLYKLHSIRLHNNKIKSISKNTFNKHIREQLTVLTLGLNPFICSCDLLWFAHWYQTEKRGIFQDKALETVKYKCHNIAGMTLKNFSLTEQACLFSREISLVFIQFCAVFIFILALVSLVFRYRWYIRLLMYEVFRGRDVLRRQRLQANNFDFDVFVSYASEDFPWVQQQLMDKLENELGLRLCVHERDFVLGRNIVDNIVQCVESSKKILMVFSESFVRSPWCQFELSLCLSHVLDYDDALIVVCVDEVTSRQMTSSMVAVLKTTTYIQWREEGEAVASFWGRLRLAFQEIVPYHEHYV